MLTSPDSHFPQAAAAEGDAPKKEERPKSPNLIAKLLAQFKDKAKSEKKIKIPKSPRKKEEKKEAVCVLSLLS